MNYLSIVAPIYNEQGTISEYVKRVEKNLLQISSYKIMLIDDGSTDDSWRVIEEICNSNKNVVGIKLSRNFGQHYAITAGLYHTNSEWVVVMDTDLQDRPEVIPDLINKTKEGYDVVFVRRLARPESFIYLVLQKFFYIVLSSLSGLKLDSTQANFSIINRKVVEAFKKFPEQSRFYGSTIFWLGFKRTSINANHGKRYHGSSSYNIKKRFKLASEIILAFSDRPLKLAIYLGFIFSAFSLMFLLFITSRALFNEFEVLGWASLIASLYLIGGIILMFLGIIGIYIAKIFSEAKSRPLFVVDKILNL